MKYSEIVKLNNPVAFTIVENAFKNDKVPHAYLFSAQPGQSADNEYKYIAQKLISKPELDDPHKYSDLTFLDGSEALIKKNDVIEAIAKLQQTTLDESGIKILVIKNIENTNKQSLNSLLKFIEEPTPKTYILMTTNNVGSVLPTIRSRSQVIMLKPLNIKNLISELEEKGVDAKYSTLLANISTSVEDAMTKFDESFKSSRKTIIKAMSNSVLNSNALITEIAPLIKKNNYVLVLSILREFISDVWKEEQLQPLSFPTQQKLIQKYVLAKFDFTNALEAINDFIVMRSFNINFDLYKNQLLIRLGESYE